MFRAKSFDTWWDTIPKHTSNRALLKSIYRIKHIWSNDLFRQMLFFVVDETPIAKWKIITIPKRFPKTRRDEWYVLTPKGDIKRGKFSRRDKNWRWRKTDAVYWNLLTGSRVKMIWNQAKTTCANVCTFRVLEKKNCIRSSIHCIQ